MNLRAAIVGLGSVAPMHIDALKAMEIEIAATCDDKKPATYTDYCEMLESGGFEVLHICLPHYLHAPVAIAALEKGINVLCEKPMATSVSDGEKMIAAAEKSGAFLGIVFQNRFNPGTQMVKFALKSAGLGAVKSGWFRVNWHREESYYTQSDWRGKKATEGGGVVINQAVHTFDLVNYFVGNPTAVSASVNNRAHPLIEVEDCAEGIIFYGETKISFYVNTYHPYDAPVAIELICENGRVEISGESALITYNDGRTETSDSRQELKTCWGNSHIRQIESFYYSVRNNINPLPSGAEALCTQKLVEAVYESAKSGVKTIIK